MGKKKKKAQANPIAPKPTLFIGSSSEARSIAEALQSQLEDACRITLWTHIGAFIPGRVLIDELIRHTRESDFGIMVFSPDDKVISRGKGYHAVRDNVILELGLFIGSVGKTRTYIIHPSDIDLKLPTDLGGVVTVSYEDSGNLDADLNTPSRKLKKAIQEAVKERQPQNIPLALLTRLVNNYPQGIEETDIALCLEYDLITPNQYDELSSKLRDKT